MAGLKERTLKRHQRGEKPYSAAVAQILAEGSIGHEDKSQHDVHKGSGNQKKYASL